MSEKTTRETLTPKQRVAVRALVSTGDVKAAAQEAGVNRSTLYKWQAEPVFVDALHAAESEALQAFSTALVGMGHLAAAALRDGLEHEDIRVRLRAADIFTGRLLQLRELVTLEERVKALEGQRNE